MSGLREALHRHWSWLLIAAVVTCVIWHAVLFHVPTDGMISAGEVRDGQYHLTTLAAPESTWVEHGISIYQAILRVDAHDITEWLERSVNPEADWQSSWQPGETHRYLADRRDGDGKRVVNATTRLPSLASIFQHLGIASLVALASLIAVVLIGRRYPDTPMLWPLALSACGSLIGLAWQTFALPFSYVALGWPLWGQFSLHILAQGLTIGAAVNLALTFTTPLAFYSRHRRVLLVLIYGLYPAGLLVGLLLQAQLHDRITWSLGWEQQAAIILQGTAYLAWAAQYRRADVTQRGRLHWVLVATAAHDFPVLMGVFAAGDALLPAQVWLGLLPPLGYMMALLPQRRLRTALLPTSGVIHGIANTLMAALFLSALGFAANILGNQGQQSLLPVVTIGLAILFALSTAPLMILLREQLDSWFNGTRGAQRALLHQFTAKVSEEIALDRITAAFREALDQGVQPAFAALWLWENETQVLRCMYPGPQAPPVIPLTAAQNQQLIVSAAYEPGSQLSFLPADTHYVGAISLVSSLDLIGVCAIGPRIDGGRYSGDALRFFETLTRSATLAFRNAQLISQLEDKVAALRRAYQQLISVQEDERQRIAAELHDETLQQLAHARLITASLNANNPAGLAALQHNITLTERRLREILRGIHPAVLTDLGLVAALESWLPHPAEVKLILSTEGFSGQRLPHADLEMTLYRLVQECVNNALKHAKASKITVTLRWQGDAVSMEVADDGIGFEPALYFATLNQAFDGSNSASGANGHFGLLNLRERSQAFDGRLTIESRPNAGTIIRVQLPIVNRS